MNLRDPYGEKCRKADERAAFEKWAKEQGWEIGIRYPDEHPTYGRYEEGAIQYMWAAWRTRAERAHGIETSEDDRVFAKRWRDLLVSINADRCRWPGLRSELLEWLRCKLADSRSEKADECRPGNCNRRNIPGDPCDRNCNWPECGCVCGTDGVMQPALSEGEDRG